MQLLRLLQGSRPATICGDGSECCGDRCSVYLCTQHRNDPGNPGVERVMLIEDSSTRRIAPRKKIGDTNDFLLATSDSHATL